MDALDFRERLFELNQLTSESINKVFLPFGKEYNLSLVQFKIMMSLFRTPNQTIGKLAYNIGVRQGNMATICKKLEDDGYVKRERASADERVVNISLTEKGEMAWFDMGKKTMEKCNIVFEKEDPETIQKIIDGMIALYGVLGKITP